VDSSLTELAESCQSSICPVIRPNGLEQPGSQKYLLVKIKVIVVFLRYLFAFVFLSFLFALSYATLLGLMIMTQDRVVPSLFEFASYPTFTLLLLLQENKENYILPFSP
jgi:hypothetical protein